MRRSAITATLVLAMAGPVHARVAIEVGMATAAPGDALAIEVSLDTDRDDVGGTGNVLSWSGPFSISSCRVNPAIGRPATVFSYAPPGCESGAACTSLR